MVDEKEPSKPYGESGKPASAPKAPSTGEPSTPPGEGKPDIGVGIPAETEKDPSQQPT